MDTDANCEVLDPWFQEAVYGDPPITSSLYSKSDMVRNVLLGMGFSVFGENKSHEYLFKKEKDRQTMVRLSERPRIKEIAYGIEQTTDFSSIEELYDHLQRRVSEMEGDTARFFDLALNMR